MRDEQHLLEIGGGTAENVRQAELNLTVARLEAERLVRQLHTQRRANAADVREQEQLWIARGVTSVPTIVFNDQYAVSGGQPAEAFVGAIRQIINEAKS